MASIELTVAYPGREGAHSAAACDRLFPAARLVPLPTFSDVIDAVVSGRVPFGVLPIESSLVGPVAETHDLLYESPLSIVAEAILPVNHCLVGPADRPALRDPRGPLPSRRPRPVPQAPRVAARRPRGRRLDDRRGRLRSWRSSADPTVVAIASDRAARLYGLTIIDDNVGDHPEAFTRFVSVAPYTRLDRRDGSWRTAFSFTTDHRPGALFHALEPLSRHAIDLNLLVSRPIPSRPFSYRFDAVLSGHPLDPEISATLKEMRDLTAELRSSAPTAPTAKAASRARRV